MSGNSLFPSLLLTYGHCEFAGRCWVTTAPITVHCYHPLDYFGHGNLGLTTVVFFFFSQSTSITLRWSKFFLCLLFCQVFRDGSGLSLLLPKLLIVVLMLQGDTKTTYAIHPCTTQPYSTPALNHNFTIICMETMQSQNHDQKNAYCHPFFSSFDFTYIYWYDFICIPHRVRVTLEARDTFRCLRA